VDVGQKGSIRPFPFVFSSIRCHQPNRTADAGGSGFVRRSNKTKHGSFLYLSNFYERHCSPVGAVISPILQGCGCSALESTPVGSAVRSGCRRLPCAVAAPCHMSSVSFNREVWAGPTTLMTTTPERMRRGTQRRRSDSQPISHSSSRQRAHAHETRRHRSRRGIRAAEEWLTILCGRGSKRRAR
jgi:hypothetical protein